MRAELPSYLSEDLAKGVDVEGDEIGKGGFHPDA